MSIPPDTFDHLRGGDDGEHIGYLQATEDGFIAFDRLWRQRSEAVSLDVAEAVLDEIGLRFLAEPWLLRTEAGMLSVGIAEVHREEIVVAPVLADAEVAVAKTLDLTRRITLPLPTDDLIEG